MLFRVLLNIIDCIADAGNLLSILVRYLDVELFLESHDQLNRVERVRAEIVYEARIRRDLGFVDAQLIHYDLLDPLFNRPFCHILAPPNSIIIIWIPIAHYALSIERLSNQSLGGLSNLKPASSHRLFERLRVLDI